MQFRFLIFLIFIPQFLWADWHYKNDSGIRIHIPPVWSTKSIEKSLEGRTPDGAVLLILLQSPDISDPEKRKEAALQRVYTLHDDVQFTSPESGETKNNYGLNVTYYSGTGVHKKSGKKAIWNAAITTNKQMVVVNVFAIEEREEIHRPTIQKILKSITKFQ